MRRFVIVVDVQRDFMRADGALPVAGAEALIAPLEAWLADLRAPETAGVLFTFDTHRAEDYARSPEAEQFPLHCARGTPGWELAVDPTVIDQAIPTWRMEKPVFDMWADPLEYVEPIRGAGPATRCDRFFDQLRESGVRDVTVVGVAADFCVRWAVEGLMARGFRVTIQGRLTRGIVREIGAVRREEWAGAEVMVA